MRNCWSISTTFWNPCVVIRHARCRMHSASSRDCKPASTYAKQHASIFGIGLLFNAIAANTRMDSITPAVPGPSPARYKHCWRSITLQRSSFDTNASLTSASVSTVVIVTTYVLFCSQRIISSRNWYPYMAMLWSFSQLPADTLPTPSSTDAAAYLWPPEPEILLAVLAWY